MEVARASSGAFDPTIGPLLRLWGFPEHPALPDSDAIRRALPLVGYERLVRTAEPAPAWRLEAHGMSVDLGGIACGYGNDRAGEILSRTSGSFLINVGGDILVGGVKPDSSAWAVGIQHPRDPAKLLMTLRLRGPCGVSTSGDYEHFVWHEGRRLHHLLDPRTGYPAPAVCSVTVIAPDGARADAESKPPFVLGPERGLQWLEERPDLEGVIVIERPDGTLDVRETSGVAALRAGQAPTATPSAEAARGAGSPP
jgi:thiamine biosynthesis lipoprotein